LGWIALKHKDELILRAKNIISTNKNIVHEWLKENPKQDPGTKKTPFSANNNFANVSLFKSK